MVVNTLGKRLSNVLQKQNISNYRLSKTIDISASRIHNYIHDKTIPDYQTLCLIADSLNVDRTWLRHGDDEFMEINYYKSSGNVNKELSKNQSNESIQELTKVISNQNEYIAAILKKYEELSNSFMELRKEFKNHNNNIQTDENIDCAFTI